jgi:hypothetical protein
VPIAAQVLKGVGHAHSREMMIRDIKPSNIMLCQRKGRSNFVKVLDFGLAKFMRNEVPLTEGYVLGTAGYLAPEAIVGGPLDLRVDVYALGVLFYHMLAGAPPFAGCEDATIFYKTINERPRPLVELLPENHGVPEGLLELIDDCLAKDASQRPADANIVVERLIDVVPATFFRLPSAAPNGAPNLAMTTRETPIGNTGLINLLDKSSPSPPPANTAPLPARKLKAATWTAGFAIACMCSTIAWFATSPRGDGAGAAQRDAVADAESLPPEVRLAGLHTPEVDATPHASVVAPVVVPVVAPVVTAAPAAEAPIEIPADEDAQVDGDARDDAKSSRAKRRPAPRSKPRTDAARFDSLPRVAAADAPASDETNAAKAVPPPQKRTSVFLSADRENDSSSRSKSLLRAD